MITVHRAAERFRTDQPGITTWHSFSSGAHYDPDNVAFGPIVACDEHVVAPRAGFARHRHARVELVSWVLGGTLRHEDDAGRAQDVEAGSAQYQLAGTGIEHVERNASTVEPLRFVQLWLLADEDAPAYAAGAPPLALRRGSVEVLRGPGEAVAPFVHLYVASGAFEAAGVALAPGDSLRAASQVVTVTGSGELLVVRVEA